MKPLGNEVHSGEFGVELARMFVVTAPTGLGSPTWNWMSLRAVFEWVYQHVSNDTGIDSEDDGCDNDTTTPVTNNSNSNTNNVNIREDNGDNSNSDK